MPLYFTDTIKTFQGKLVCDECRYYEIVSVTIDLGEEIDVQGITDKFIDNAGTQTNSLGTHFNWTVINNEAFCPGCQIKIDEYSRIDDQRAIAADNIER